MISKTLLSAAFVAICLSTSPATAQGATVEVTQEYIEFSEYEAGIVLPQLIAEDVFRTVLFVDTRDPRQITEGTISDAINIEWRELRARNDQIPTDRRVILFCNTGDLSAPAVFALRVAERDNVLRMQTGLTGGRKTPHGSRDAAGVFSVF